jgi:adenine-specific DNA-methyltransferase
MHLDDIESETAPRVEQYLAKIKAIRRIAHKIIDFLAQIENFQKKLWLKKKFVVETQYCVTLDRVPEELYPEIAANDAQREEWVRLFAIDEITAEDAENRRGKKGRNQEDLFPASSAPSVVKYSIPLSVEFLKANPYLVLDTRHFSEDFKRRLLASFDDLDEQCDGLLIHSENFQALNLLMERYRGQVKCIYIDPPYNTGSDEFVYKDCYQTSSWLQFLMDRLLLAHRLLADDGVLVIQISDHEDHRLKLLLDVVFGPESFVNRISVKTRSPSGFKTVNLGVFEAAEYLYVYAKDKKALAPPGCLYPL